MSKSRRVIRVTVPTSRPMYLATSLAEVQLMPDLRCFGRRRSCGCTPAWLPQRTSTSVWCPGRSSGCTECLHLSGTLQKHSGQVLCCGALLADDLFNPGAPGSTTCSWLRGVNLTPLLRAAPVLLLPCLGSHRAVLEQGFRVSMFESSEEPNIKA